MSYSVCIHGGSMCDGCMSCYDDRYDDEDEYDSIFDFDAEDLVFDEDEEEEDDD